MKADLAKLRALHEAATPGEWAQAHRESRGGYNTEVFDANGETIATLAWHAKPPRYEDGRKIVSTDRPENAALIVAAVNALPELLAIAEAVERARADIESIAAMMDYTDACEYAVELRAVVRLLTIGTVGHE